MTSKHLSHVICQHHLGKGQALKRALVGVAQHELQVAVQAFVEPRVVEAGVALRRGAGQQAKHEVVLGDEVVGRDYIGPCGGACEDHGGFLEDGGPRKGAQNYFGHRDPNPGTHHPAAGSYVSPFAYGYRTKLSQPLFLIGGCLLDW